MVARTASLGGCLFLFFLIIVFVVLNVPLDNFLNLIFKKHKKIITVIEVVMYIQIAYLLAHWSEPVVSKYIRYCSEFIVDILARIYKALMY